MNATNRYNRLPQPVPLRRVIAMAAVLSALLGLAGCSRVITPATEPAERAKAAKAEAVFARPVEKRALPDLSKDASLPSVLDYAFNANGELEAAYRDWRAAIERVQQAGALPDPRIEFKALFNPLNSSFFDTVLDSVSVGFSQEIPRKAKRKARAEQSLALAQAEGSRFRQAKYSLQTKVTRVYAGLALNARLTELNAETLRLFRETYDITLRRYNTMAEGNLADLRKIEAEIQKTESETRALGIERDRLTGEMNGLLNRPAGSAYGKAELRRFRASTDSEAEMFARAVRNNPELAAQRKEIAARGAAQVLAELEKKPDFEVNGELGYALSGSVTPTLGFSTTLPINRARIRAGIAEALAMRQASEAKYRAAESDALARLVMALNAIRDTRRILDDYQNHIIPTTKEALDTQLSTYGSGGGDFLDILDTERLLIDYRKLVLQAEADRLRFYAEVQDVLGEDLLLLNDAPAAGGPKRD